MNSPEGKRILADIRAAPYAHAGEREAVELVLSGVAKDSGRRILDAGCGLGGTAHDMQSGGWGMVTGFDIDEVSVARARELFPHCTFVAADVGSVAGVLRGPFDLITCFNSFYAMPQQRALSEMAVLAHSQTELLVFDYTDPNRTYAASEFGQREDADFWHPPCPDDFAVEAAESGWRLAEFSDLTARYQAWYVDLCGRIADGYADLARIHGRPSVDFVCEFYGALRDTFSDGTLGGGLFRLTR